jgi:UTP--glucose-1-phosphate uridylyltransferase
MAIQKAIITAAGYGTRFLPATKNVPKELLPVINKPTIHYIVEDCIKAGIKDIIVVTRFGNHAVEDFFDTTPALEAYLESKGKHKEAEAIHEIYSSANFIFIRQDPDLPYGNASPLYSAKSLIGKDEAFIYAWGDDIILGEDAGIQEIVNDYQQNYADVILNCTKVDKEQVTKLGIVKFKHEGSLEIEQIIEKPTLEESPSNIASVSPYLLNANIFDYLDPSKIEPGKEFMIQNAIDTLCKQGTVRANITKGTWLTTGDPLNYLKATVEIALSRDDLREDFLKYLSTRI